MEAVKYLRAIYSPWITSSAPASNPSQLLSYFIDLLYCLLVLSTTSLLFSCGSSITQLCTFTKVCCLHRRASLVLPTADGFVMLTLGYCVFLEREVWTVCFQKAKVIKHFSLYDSLKTRYQILVKGFNVEEKVRFNSSESGVAQSCLTLQQPHGLVHQALLSMGFSRQEYWSGLLFPFPGDLPNPGIGLGSPALQADSLHQGTRSQKSIQKTENPKCGQLFCPFWFSFFLFLFIFFNATFLFPIFPSVFFFLSKNNITNNTQEMANSSPLFRSTLQNNLAALNF